MRLCYHCAVEFGWTANETLDQDETLVDDMLQFGREKNYQQWAQRHDIDIDEVSNSFTSDVLDYRAAIGLTNESI